MESASSVASAPRASNPPLWLHLHLRCGGLISRLAHVGAGARSSLHEFGAGSSSPNLGQFVQLKQRELDVPAGKGFLRTGTVLR